jgi:hypothetical protein
MHLIAESTTSASTRFLQFQFTAAMGAENAAETIGSRQMVNVNIESFVSESRFLRHGSFDCDCDCDCEYEYRSTEYE